MCLLLDFCIERLFTPYGHCGHEYVVFTNVVSLNYASNQCNLRCLVIQHVYSPNSIQLQPNSLHFTILYSTFLLTSTLLSPTSHLCLPLQLCFLAMSWQDRERDLSTLNDNSNASSYSTPYNTLASPGGELIHCLSWQGVFNIHLLSDAHNLDLIVKVEVYWGLTYFVLLSVSL